MTRLPIPLAAALILAAAVGPAAAAPIPPEPIDQLATPPSATITDIETDDELPANGTPGGRVLYARTAAPHKTAQDGWSLRVDVRVRNTTNAPITVIGFSIFTNITASKFPNLEEPKTIGPHGAARIKVPLRLRGGPDMPSTLTLRARLAGGKNSAWTSADLIEYKAPTSNKGYAFPGRLQDLPPKTYWSAGVHDHSLTQGYAYDFGARRWDAVDRKWSAYTVAARARERSGGLKAGKRNADFMVFNRRLFSPGNLRIVRCVRSVAENVPGTRGKGGGNGLVMATANNTYIAYYHLRQYSIPKALCPFEGPKGTDMTPLSIPIKTGQFLGRVGNTGRSTGPHLHAHEVDHPGGSSSTARGVPLRYGGVAVLPLAGSQGLYGWNVLPPSASAMLINVLIRPLDS